MIHMVQTMNHLTLLTIPCPTAALLYRMPITAIHFDKLLHIKLIIIFFPIWSHSLNSFYLLLSILAGYPLRVNHQRACDLYEI